MKLSKMREYAKGILDESALKAPEDDSFDLEDQEFMQECAALAMPLILESEILSEATEKFGEIVNEAYQDLFTYMQGQGLINEAMNISNPRINYVRLNRDSQINRLTKIVTLKLARKTNDKSYKKFKIAHALKKKSMGEMMKKYGSKAERLAKKLWADSKKHSKITAVIDAKKDKASGK